MVGIFLVTCNKFDGITRCNKTHNTHFIPNSWQFINNFDWCKVQTWFVRIDPIVYVTRVWSPGYTRHSIPIPVVKLELQIQWENEETSFMVATPKVRTAANALPKLGRKPDMGHCWLCISTSLGFLGAPKIVFIIPLFRFSGIEGIPLELWVWVSGTLKFFYFLYVSKGRKT